MAVTGEEAAAAIKEGEGLANQMAAAQKLQGQDLEKEVAALKQVRFGAAKLILQRNYEAGVVVACFHCCMPIMTNHPFPGGV